MTVIGDLVMCFFAAESMAEFCDASFLLALAWFSWKIEHPDHGLFFCFSRWKMHVQISRYNVLHSVFLFLLSLEDVLDWFILFAGN